MNLGSYKWTDEAEPYAKNIQAYARRLSRITPTLQMEDLLQTAQVAIHKGHNGYPIRTACCAMNSLVRNVTKRGKVLNTDEEFEELFEQEFGDPLAREQFAFLMTELGKSTPLRYAKDNYAKSNLRKHNTARKRQVKVLQEDLRYSTDDEIARRMKCAPRTVRSLRKHGRDFIRENWKQ